MRMFFASITLLLVTFNVSSVFGVDNKAMHEAAAEGNLELMKQLKEQGADVNVVNKYLWTPMHYAAINGHLDAMKWLKEQGAKDLSINNLTIWLFILL